MNVDMVVEEIRRIVDYVVFIYLLNRPVVDDVMLSDDAAFAA